MGVTQTMHHHSLTDPNIPLVADTSVIINLVASGIPEQLLSHISNPIYVVDEVLPELGKGSEKGCHDADVLNKLIDDGVVTRVSLNDEGWEHFGNLVSGRAKTSLDDGEAATLAYCAVHKTIPIIDERKANKVCKEQFTYLKPISSAAVFKIAGQGKNIHEVQLSKAVYNALSIGRMFVMHHHLEWIVDTIGPEKAANCNSLSKRSRRLMTTST